MRACKVGWIRAYETDEMAATLAVARLIELREELARPAAPPPAPKALTNTSTTLTQIKRRKRNAIDLATDGGMDAKQLREALARLDEEAMALRRRAESEVLGREAAARAADPTRRATVLRQAKTWRVAWARMTVEQRQIVLQELASKIEVGRSGVRCTWRTAEDLAAQEERAASPKHRS